MMVLACWQTPAAIRHVGVDRITALLRRGHVKNTMQVAEALVAAARQQTVTLPGQRAAAVVVGQMAAEILALEQRIAAVDDLIADQLDQHPLAPIIGSLPGMGPLLTAELLVHTAGMTEYDSPAKLAAHAGLAPVSRDSGTASGNHRQPRRYHRRLRHILWMAAFTALVEQDYLRRVLLSEGPTCGSQGAIIAAEECGSAKSPGGADSIVRLGVALLADTRDNGATLGAVVVAQVLAEPSPGRSIAEVLDVIGST